MHFNGIDPILFAFGYYSKVNKLSKSPTNSIRFRFSSFFVASSFSYFRFGLLKYIRNDGFLYKIIQQLLVYQIDAGFLQQKLAIIPFQFQLAYSPIHASEIGSEVRKTSISSMEFSIFDYDGV